MLVLSRKPGEQIVIGDNIRITVVSLGPGRVKVGIEAPGTVKVDRAEIHEKKLGGEPAPEAVVAPAGPAHRFSEPVPTAVVEVAALHSRFAAPTTPGRVISVEPRFRPRKPR